MYFQPQPHPYAAIPSEPKIWPVIVVGAGPVGLAAALGLAQRGVEALVLEAGDTASYGSRAICVSRNSLQILDRLGVGDTLVAAALPWTGGRSYYRDLEVLHFQMPAAAEQARPPMVNISQSVVEQILIDAVEAQPDVVLRWGCRVGHVREDGESVVVGVETPDGSTTVRARWLVAADGARSTTRDSLGLTLSGTSYEGRYVIADIHWPSDWPTERRVWFDPPSNPGATIIMHRQPDDIWRVDYQLRPEDDAEREVSDARVRERITRHLEWVGTSIPFEIEWISLYRAHALSLQSYRAGRVMFVGDSAHLLPIFGVRGLNSGFEDADDLAWKLALVLAGTASPELLDSFSVERRSAWEQNIAFAAKSTLFMTPGSHGYEKSRQAALSLVAAEKAFAHLVNPRQSSATHARRSPLTVAAPTASALLPGDVIDDRVLQVRRAGDWVDATLRGATGPGFAVLGAGRDPTVVAEAAAAGRAVLGGAIDVVAVVLDDEADADDTDDVNDTGDVNDPGDGAVTGASPDDGVVRLRGDDTLLAAAGAVPGDLLVLRPDGRILARVGEVASVRAAFEGVARGTQPAGAPAGVPDPASGDPEVGRVEHVWQTLSDLLNDVPEDDREVALLQIAMQLALSHQDPDALTRCCSTARERR